jgi:hypothetical protein
MGAPRGNQFWKARSKHGRDKIFASADLLWKACEEYFEWVENNPLWETKLFAYQGDVSEGTIPKMRAMTIGGLCIFLDIDQATWFAWRKREDFCNVTARAEEVIRTQKFAGAAADLLNANIIARDLGLKEATAHEHTSPDGSMTPKGNIDLSQLSDQTLQELMNARSSGSK